MNVYSLTDVCMWRHPESCQFSYHSDSSCIMSSINLAFATHQTHPYITTSSFLPKGISDHAPLLLELQPLPSSNPILWQLNSQWLGDQVVQGECFKGIADFLNPNLNTATLIAECEAFNATIHDTFFKNTQMCMEEHVLLCYRWKLITLLTLLLTSMLPGYISVGYMSSTS